MRNTGAILADLNDARDALEYYVVLAKDPPHMPAILEKIAVSVNAGDRDRALECSDAMLGRDRRDNMAKRFRKVILGGMCPDG